MRNLGIRLYRYNEAALEHVYRKLAQSPFELTVWEDSRLKGSVETETGGTLFLSIPYDEGWSITVDGEKKTAKKLFDAFMGIELSPGSHVIEMQYMPRGLKMGAAISLRFPGCSGCCLWHFPFQKAAREKADIRQKEKRKGQKPEIRTAAGKRKPALKFAERGTDKYRETFAGGRRGPGAGIKEKIAMKLWGGRFTKEENQLVHSFNASISFDQKLYRQDIEGSIAHVMMLARQEIISEEDREAITEGLQGILKDLESGTLMITPEYEDIHSFVESQLTERIGEAGKRLHTGRSRNDQVALDMKLYTRDEIDELDSLVRGLLKVLVDMMEKNLDTYMPGFTHLQKAQPITLAHHLGAYAEMFFRDLSRLHDIRERMNYCPLGAGALAGTTYPLDREYTASLLGFYGATLNSMDSVSDRDYLIEFLSALSVISMHLSRFCEEIIIWNTNEYRFVELDDSYSTGSSIMPQKKNPDIAELIRGKTGRVYGALISLLTTMKGLPLAYNKDMQEDKELTFDAIDTVEGSLALFTDMLSSMSFRKDVMEQSAKNGFTNATDAADYLVNRGVPFRDAHGIIGRLVLLCIERGCSLDELPLEEYRKVSPVFEKDVYNAISMENCVKRRVTAGAPGQDAMKRVIDVYRQRLDAQEGSLEKRKNQA